MVIMERFGRLLQAFSGTLGCAIALLAFELWGGNPKRIPSLFLLIVSGVLALVTFLRFFDEGFKKTFLFVGAFSSFCIFMVSGVSIRRGWLGFGIDVSQGGVIGEWVLAMICMQVILIFAYKISVKIVSR